MATTDSNNIATFVKYNRSKLRMTQEELADKAGVGLRFIRELEQGKETLRMDKINQVLALFGYSIAPSSERKIDPYDIMLNHFVGKNVHIFLKNRTELIGFIMEPVFEEQEIKGWKFVSNNNAMEFQKTNDPKLLQDINHSDIEKIENIDIQNYETLRKSFIKRQGSGSGMAG
jgi:y4mF family transcriptional regulator